MLASADQLENLPQLPDGKAFTTMEMNCLEKQVAERINKSFADGRRMIIGRSANHTAKLGERAVLPVQEVNATKVALWRIFQQQFGHVARCC